MIGRPNFRRHVLLALAMCVFAPLFLGFLCFPLIPPPPSGVPTPVPAANFAPTVSASVLNSSPGAASNIEAHLSFPAGSTLAIGASFNVPAGWTVASDGGVTNGAIVGSIRGFMTVDDPAPLPPLTTFGCTTTVDFDPNEVPPTDIKLLEATTSTSTKVSGADTDNNGKPQVVEDLNLNGLPDGVDKYPAFLNALLPGTHKARYFGHTNAAGLSDLYVNIVVTQVAFGAPYRVVTIVNDPTSRPESATNRFCAPQSITLALFGASQDNPATTGNETGQLVYANPVQGAYTFSAQLVSEFDADNDGDSNGFDNCPFTSNGNQADTDQDYTGDACDPNSAVQNFDEDADGTENGYDNCMFTANATQLDKDFDDIGDACDANPNAPNGPNFWLSCSDPVGIGQADPGGATCVKAVPTPTVTPTPKNPNGDTDGDTIPNSTDPNDDNDACTDAQELGPNEGLGGRRNPHNKWDFYDPNGNKTVDLFNDIFGVAAAFGQGSGGPDYAIAKDRSAPPPPGTDANDPRNNEPWDMGPPDDIIDLFNDIFGVANQFGHDCTAPK